MRRAARRRCGWSRARVPDPPPPVRSVSSDEWTELYRQDIASLRARIISALEAPATAPRTGPQLVTMLRTIVAASNNGSIAEIPSVWKLFVAAHSADAARLAAAALSSGLAAVTPAEGVAPPAGAVFRAGLASAAAAASAMYNSLVLGLPVGPGERAAVMAGLEERSAAATLAHRYAAAVWCAHVASACVEDLRVALGNMSLPMAIPTLRGAVAAAVAGAAAVHAATAGPLECGDAASAAARFDALARQRIEDGQALVEEQLRRAAGAGDRACDATMRAAFVVECAAGEGEGEGDASAAGCDSVALMSSEDMDAVAARMVNASLSEFDAIAGVVAGEPGYVTARQALQHRCGAETAAVARAANEARVRELGAGVVERIVEGTVKAFQAVPVPKVPSELERVYDEQLLTAISAFRAAMARFKGLHVIDELFTSLTVGRRRCAGPAARLTRWAQSRVAESHDVMRKRHADSLVLLGRAGCMASRCS